MKVFNGGSHILMQAMDRTSYRDAPMHRLTRTLALAHTRDALAHAWVDTVSVDKLSSAELAEAINSMFAWYANAAVCYVLMSPFGPGPGSRPERFCETIEIGCLQWREGKILDRALEPFPTGS